MKTPKAVLRIQSLELSVFLGWSQKERLRDQTVFLDIKITFPKSPKACITDNLEDTICYHSLINTIRENLHGRHFHLIEHLSHDIFDTIESILPSKTHLRVTITKHPQIEGLKNGVSFTYGTIT